MPSFRTKRGRCHLENGWLRLESSFRGQLRRYREGNRLLYWSYLALPVVLAAFVLTQLLAGEVIFVLLVAIALLVLRGVQYYRGFTAEDEIPLEAITGVAAVEGTPWLTRPRFVLTYERDGTEMHRYVLMPSTLLSYGEAEFERAKSTFRDAGVPVEDASAE